MARQKFGSLAHGKRVVKSGKPTPDSEIDFSDLPELTGKELKEMKRVGRPPLGANSRQLIAIRVDPEVLEKIRRAALKAGKGYQTLINEILTKFTDKKSA